MILYYDAFRVVYLLSVFFFFKQKTAYEMRISDWSSDVCSSDLTKTYQRGPEKIAVLHGLDLDIDKGDFVALMGPSGSGKTTLLNLIGGLDTPSGGEIEIDGARIDQMGAGQLSQWRSDHVGFVFQFYNLMPMLTAQRNVELPLLLTNLGAAQRKRNAEIALQLVGLGDRAKHKPNELRSEEHTSELQSLMRISYAVF